MKRFLLLFAVLYSLCVSAYSQASGFTGVKFGQYQIADSQWNVSACMYTSTCQIYSTQPGTAYKIPWTSGKISWASGDYISFVATGDPTNPYNAIQYTSGGQQKAVMGTGRIINMGLDANGKALFFFVGNDNNTGQLFSMNAGLTGTSGYTWTGTLNPTTSQVDSFASTYGTSTPLASGQTYTAAPAAPSLCCGGSATAFNPDAVKSARVQAYVNRVTGDTQVYIEQIGNSNIITVQQTGTNDNYVKYVGNGSFNDISINQSGNNSTVANYTEVKVGTSTAASNSNKIEVTQQSTGGVKSAFIAVENNNNNVKLLQKDSGGHYADIQLSGGSKTVDITQQGTANHMTSVNLGGLATSLTLTQTGSTQQFYSITHTCATAGGCSPITVTQGQ